MAIYMARSLSLSLYLKGILILVSRKIYLNVNDIERCLHPSTLLSRP